MDCAMDRGFDNRKTQGLLCKNNSRMGIMESRRSDQFWTADNESKGERERTLAGKRRRRRWWTLLAVELCWNNDFGVSCFNERLREVEKGMTSSPNYFPRRSTGPWRRAEDRGSSAASSFTWRDPSMALRLGMGGS